MPTTPATLGIDYNHHNLNQVLWFSGLDGLLGNHRSSYRAITSIEFLLEWLCEGSDYLVYNIC